MKLHFISSIFVIASLSACKVQDHAARQNQSDSYNISVGGQFHLELASNSSTGYSWQWSNKDSVTIVDIVDQRYIADTPGLAGGGGREKWTFKGVSPGEQIIKIDYCRSWEANCSGDSKVITVTVK